MTEFTVRPARLEDWRAIRTLRLESLLDTPDAYGTTYAEALSWDEDQWRHLATTRNYYVAEQAGELIGMLSGSTHDERGGHWLFTMYVTPRARGGRVASALVEAVAEWARRDGGDALSLYVTTSVPRARTFYAKMGFVETGEVITMDRDPRLTLVAMERPLRTFRVDRVVPARLHDLRRRVLRSNNPDISVADPRDEEATSLHFAGLLDENVVVSASYYPSRSPLDDGRVTYQLRYMAADPAVQGNGYGRAVATFAEARLRELGVQAIWANGRDTALGFYRATGWALIAGTEHRSPETDLPHTVIYKVLQD